MTPNRHAARKPTGSDIAGKLIQAGERTQTTALGLAPQPHVAILQMVFVVVAGLGLLGGGYVIYMGNSAAGVIVLLAAMVLAAIGMYLVRPQGHAITGPSAAAAKPLADWSRVTVKLPVPPGPLQELSDALHSIRSLAQGKYEALLRARQSQPAAIDANNLRVNVFLPDSQSALQGEVCGMHIPVSLHHGMTDEDERRIRFRPNEGLTGRVFTLEKAFGALRQAEDAQWDLILLQGPGGKGDETFQLTVTQVKLINPALRWIVGFPLSASVSNATQTFGVLNVDGLVEPLTGEEMQALFNHLAIDVKKFAADVWRVDKNRISIAVEEYRA